MEDFLTYIGSIASIGSIPLAIYLYLKSKEQKKDKVRRDILKIISYQIGENRKLDLFEIEKVLNSNLRNNKLTNDSINIKSILEDLISDTIASPLLDSQRKNEILYNIKGIFPDKKVLDVKYSTTRFSTLFALMSILISTSSIAIILLIGENDWNNGMDKLISFNIIKGFWPNLLLSGITAILGIILSYFIFFKINRTKEITP